MAHGGRSQKQAASVGRAAHTVTAGAHKSAHWAQDDASRYARWTSIYGRLRMTDHGPEPESRPRLLPFTSKLGFGVGQLAEGITLSVFNTFVLFYFNQILGVSGTLTGIALGVALFFDAITDPLAGSVSDRLQTRWGRRHPMMAAASLPMALSLIALFNPPSGMSEIFYFAWLVTFAVLARLFLTLYHIPHLALGAEMAQDYLDRTRVYSYSQLFGTLGTWGFGFLMLSLVFPTTDAATHGMLHEPGYRTLSIVAGAGS